MHDTRGHRAAITRRGEDQDDFNFLVFCGLPECRSVFSGNGRPHRPLLLERVSAPRRRIHTLFWAFWDVLKKFGVAGHTGYNPYLEELEAARVCKWCQISR